MGKEDQGNMPRLMLDAVYVDMPTGKVIGLKPKFAFPPLFNLEVPLEASEALLVAGDPGGLRSRSRSGYRQSEGEFAPFSHFALNPHSASVELNHLFSNGEA
jgi:hypothetical protein